jgi:hypothetical protein
MRIDIQSTLDFMPFDFMRLSILCEKFLVPAKTPSNMGIQLSILCALDFMRYANFDFFLPLSRLSILCELRILVRFSCISGKNGDSKQAQT